MRTLGEIMDRVPGLLLHGDPQTPVSGVTHDSRQVRPGVVFAAVPGQSVDGTVYVTDAIRMGAAAILTEHALKLPIPVIVADNVRSQLGAFSAACFGFPGNELTLIGVTGTNGKTSITRFVEAGFRNAGRPCGVMGTIGYQFGDLLQEASHTTPEATVIHETLRRMRNAGAQAVVMEASSHGLSLGRLDGCLFDVVAFTNLTQDHLDFHRTMADYGASKMRLFTNLVRVGRSVAAVVNIDDPFSSEILMKLQIPPVTVSCSIGSTADFRPIRDPDMTIDGIRAEIQTPVGEAVLNTPMVGMHNLSNLLVALGICHSAGVPVETALESFVHCSVPGRMERVSGDGDCAVFVDYAHTPDALVRALEALQPLTDGRLICVFGCGGGRDTGKRPIMGAAVAAAADVAVITSDNPRTEDPSAIIDSVEVGVRNAGMTRLPETSLQPGDRGYLRTVDRADAIDRAIAMATPCDTVLIAGKGHEDYVIIGTEKRHFDDREQARAALARPGRGGGA